jgi:pyridoxal/pyridoxine/pyridoxamine kinase
MKADEGSHTGDLFAALFVSSLIGRSTTAVALADAVSSSFAVLKEAVSAGAEENFSTDG